jgi:hypothetical protein
MFRRRSRSKQEEHELLIGFALVSAARCELPFPSSSVQSVQFPRPKLLVRPDAISPCIVDVRSDENRRFELELFWDADKERNSTDIHGNYGEHRFGLSASDFAGRRRQQLQPLARITELGNERVESRPLAFSSGRQENSSTSLGTTTLRCPNFLNTDHADSVALRR